MREANCVTCQTFSCRHFPQTITNCFLKQLMFAIKQNHHEFKLLLQDLNTRVRLTKSIMIKVSLEVKDFFYFFWRDTTIQQKMNCIFDANISERQNMSEHKKWWSAQPKETVRHMFIVRNSGKRKTNKEVCCVMNLRSYQVCSHISFTSPSFVFVTWVDLKAHEI